MVPGIDPKVDYAFKRLFGVERNRHLLIDLIEAVIEPSLDERIAEVELLNPFSEKEALDDRLIVLDIKARDQSGRRFNVEMQMLPHVGFRERILYYWAQLHHDQLHEGDQFHELQPTISICFVNGNLFPQVPDYRLQFGLRDDRHGLVFSSQLAIYVVELRKFDKDLPQVSAPLDRWLYFLRHAETMDTDGIPSELNVPTIQQSLEELQMLSQTELERERYQRRQLAIRDDMARREDARQEGLQKGRQEGELVDRILFCESLLNRPASNRDELYGLPIDELQQRADALERDFRQSRNGNGSTDRE